MPTRPFRGASALLCAVLVLTSLIGVAHADPVPDDARLEQEGARIGAIRVVPLQVFDTQEPGDDRALFRLANRLHRVTREEAVRAQLLFRSGDRYSRRTLDETERNIRSLDFVREPRIVPIAYHDGVVDVEVITQDVWTLQPGVSLSRSGGSNRNGISMADQNLLGLGKAIEVGRTRDVDRVSEFLSWRDPDVLGSRWQDGLEATRNDDGKSWSAQLLRPFYSIATRWSAGIGGGELRSNPERYSLGKVYDSYERRQRDADLFLGRKLGTSEVWNQHLTIGFREADAYFTAAGAGKPMTLLPLPADRQLHYPYLRFDLNEERFDTTRNVDQIARTEDLHYGWSASIEQGWLSPGLGADRSGWIASVDVGYGLAAGDRQSLFLAGAWRARRESVGLLNELRTASARYYLATSANTKFHVQARGDWGRALDGDSTLELGGDNGLRGYPLRYQQGSSRVLVTLEERYYSKLYLLRLFHVGAVAFMDVGRTWGSSPVNTPQLGWQRDLGIGLRFSSSRTSFGNVIHVDLAAPLDGGSSISRLQLLFGSQLSF